MEEEYMPAEYFIRLLAQSIILEAFICRNFPSIGINRRMNSVIETAIQNFCQNPFPLSRSAEAVNRLQQNIIENLDNLYSSLQELSTKSPRTQPADVKDFQYEYTCFITIINQRFKQIKALLANFENNTSLSQSMITFCLEVVQQEHEQGKELARNFFKHTQLPKAMLMPKHYLIQDRQETSLNSSLQTLSERDER